MVTFVAIHDENATRWFGYLVASFCLVLLLSSYFEFSKPQQPQETIQKLQVSFRSIAAPKPIIKKKVFEHPAVPKVLKTPAVVTHKKALRKAPALHKKIKALQKKVVPLPDKKPIEVKKTEKPQPKLLQARSENTGVQKTNLIKNARYRKQTPPIYPQRSFELGQQGLVTIHAEILPNGKSKTLKIVKSSGHRRLDLAALSAVKKWEFETEQQANTSTTWVRVPVRFIIN